MLSVDVDGEGGKWLGGTIEVDVETLLETIVSYIFTDVQSNTHMHMYIPWIHKSVIKKVGCGTSHKYTK